MSFGPAAAPDGTGPASSPTTPTIAPTAAVRRTSAGQVCRDHGVARGRRLGQPRRRGARRVVGVEDLPIHIRRGHPARQFAEHEARVIPEPEAHPGHQTRARHGDRPRGFHSARRRRMSAARAAITSPNTTCEPWISGSIPSGSLAGSRMNCVGVGRPGRSSNSRRIAPAQSSPPANHKRLNASSFEKSSDASRTSIACGSGWTTRTAWFDSAASSATRTCAASGGARKQPSVPRRLQRLQHRPRRPRRYRAVRPPPAMRHRGPSAHRRGRRPIPGCCSPMQFPSPGQRCVAASGPKQ